MGEPAGILNLNEAKPGVRVFTDPSGACGKSRQFLYWQPTLL